MIRFCILSVIFLLVEGKNETQKCNFVELLDCVLIRNRFPEESGNPFPATENELKRQCEILQEMTDCVRNYGNTCMTSMDRQVGAFMLSGAEQRLNDLCDPTHQIHKDYLKEMGCIVNNYKVSCAKDLTTSVMLMFHDSSRSKLFTACCGFNEMRKCIDDHFKDKCGDRAAELMAVQIEILSSDWILEMCKPFEESKNECPPLPEVDTRSELYEIYKDYNLVKYIAPYT